MEPGDFLKIVDTRDLIEEIRDRFPVGFVMGFVSSDVVRDGKKVAGEFFVRSGPRSIQRGLSQELVNHILDKFDEEDECDDEYQGLFDNDDEFDGIPH